MHTPDKHILAAMDKAGKGGLGNHIISVCLTIAIVLVLVIPAKGVIVDLLSDKTIYKKNDIITFTVSVDIEDNERMPIQNLRLRISSSSAGAQLVKECVFSLSGAKLSGCENILVITPLNTQGYGSGDSFGYGYGYDDAEGYGYANQSFVNGSGYGYSAGYTGLNGELAYNITWNITADNVNDGNYAYDLWAYADDEEGNSRIYSDSSLLSFEYDGTAPAITIEEIIEANNTNPVLNVTTSENANCLYKNSTGEFAAMETTGTTAHTHTLSLYPGNFSYTVECTDSTGNTGNDSINFTIISGTAVVSSGRGDYQPITLTIVPVEPVPRAPRIPLHPPIPKEKPAEDPEPAAVPEQPDPGPLFDFAIKVLNHMKKVFAGDYLMVEFTSINLGEPGIVYAAISYTIIDSAGDYVLSDTIDISVEAEQSFVEKIYIPEGLAPGKYNIKARLDYDSQFAEAEDYFDILKSQPKIVALYTGLGILLLLLIVAGAFFFILIRKKKEETDCCEESKSLSKK